MDWLIYLGSCAYCVGLIPVWSAVYFGARSKRGRFRSWAIASGLALLWPWWVVQYRRWLSQQTWVDQLERELQHLTR